jgi:hypothetical protein
MKEQDREQRFMERIEPHQRILYRLAMLRVREVKWIILLGPVLWMPLLMVLFHGILGLDVFEFFSHAALLIHLAVGLALSLLLWGAARLVSTRYRAVSWLQWLRREIAGEEITHAKEILERYEAFERE